MRHRARVFDEERLLAYRIFYFLMWNPVGEVTIEFDSEEAAERVERQVRKLLETAGTTAS